jgi:hypothetical protein
MNNITLEQIKVAEKITETQYNDAKKNINSICKKSMVNNNIFNILLFNKYKIIIKLYELYHFINLDYVVSDKEFELYYK